VIAMLLMFARAAAARAIVGPVVVPVVVPARQ
jgi:hypothetical protein